MIELVKGIDEHIYTLVFPLIASAYADKYSILRHFLAAHSRSYGHKFLPCPFPESVILLVSCRGEARFESVRGHYIYRPSEELSAFLGRNVAHCREDVAVQRSLLLERVSCDNIEMSGLLIT